MEKFDKVMSGRLYYITHLTLANFGERRIIAEVIDLYVRDLVKCLGSLLTGCPVFKKEHLKLNRAPANSTL